jgi:hypothetical protein
MVSECPLSGLSTNWVTPGFLRCFWYAAWEIACGTVWSFSPEMMRMGPRFCALKASLVSLNGFRVGDRLEDGHPQ